MTTERLVGVALPLDEQTVRLIADVRSAAGRAALADPGDRLDIVRHEALSSQLEIWAHMRRNQAGSVQFDLDADARPDPTFADALPLPSWVRPSERTAVERVVESGGVVIALCLPLEVGARVADGPAVQAPPPARAWRAGTETIYRKDGSELEREITGRRAVEKRFTEQLEAAVSGADPEPVYPTGIQNRVLSETLRTYVHRRNGDRRVDVPVEYRDGSRAQHPFPLRSLKLIPAPEEPHDIVLSLALLSIRHTEMDTLVDGAWLRNAQISQVRPQAETDDLVYGLGRLQLEALTEHGTRRVKLEIFQTGLEPANVGFYRAVTDHLLTYPGSLSVIPQYYQEPRRQGSSRSAGRPRGARTTGGPTGRHDDTRRAAGSPAGVGASAAEFLPGKVWATRRGGHR